LPDGLFSNQKSQFGENFSVPQFGKCLYILWPFGIFYGYLGYFVTIWNILCSVGTVFSCFGVLHQEKSGNPVYRHCSFLEGTIFVLGLVPTVYP
jgi:hypothetical protein